LVTIAATRGDYIKLALILLVLSLVKLLKHVQFSKSQKYDIVHVMKYMMMAIMVMIFVALPLYVLNALIMPDLMSLKNTYQHADDIATRIVVQP
jgi:hypothetical protein